MRSTSRTTHNLPTWFVVSLLPGYHNLMPRCAAFTPSTQRYNTHVRPRGGTLSDGYLARVTGWSTEKEYDSLDMDDTVVELEDADDDDGNARSQFGTKKYWDDVYDGRGDFPAEEYSWYFGWEILEAHVKEHIPSTSTTTGDKVHILCPGIGNDPLLVDLYRSQYTQLTAFDYSNHAIERQEDLISFELPSKAMDTIELHTMDARKLPDPGWNERFDAIVEKGALDAVYLSGDGNVERAVENLHRVLKPGGICLSISGVVPQELRNELFQDWEWLRDGSDELQAGCFVLRKPALL